MVAFFGVVFIVEGGMVVWKTEGGGYAVCVLRLGLLQLWWPSAFKVLGHGGGASMVAFFGVVFIVEGGMVVWKAEGGGYAICVLWLGLLQLCFLGLGFCSWLWAFIFYFNVLVDGYANSLT
jgi:hypothetical protein